MKNLQVSTPTDREIVITRTFNAPRRLVFEAMTKPEFMKQWLFGPDGWSFAVCEIDLRVGGSFRYVWRGPDGSEMGMSGIIHEVVPPERIVQTEKFDAYPNEAVGTLVLIEQAGKTNLTLTMLYDTKETRDAVLKSGMEHGMAAGYDRLERLLPSFVSTDRT